MEEQDAALDLKSIFKKYHWAAAVLLLGIFFMALPEKQSAMTGVTEAPAAAPCIQQELENLLQYLEGAGKVRLLLTQDWCSGPIRHVIWELWCFVRGQEIRR